MSKEQILEVTEDHPNMIEINVILNHFEEQLENEWGEIITSDQRAEIISCLSSHPILRILSCALESYGYDSF